MRIYDTAVIGGGILGCFAARYLSALDISLVLLEASDDVCSGISKANSAIVYAGYDNRRGSLKAKLTLRGNRDFGRLCQELDVPFSRCGSLMVSFCPEGDAALEKKLAAGLENSVPGLQLISGQQARELEPMLANGVSKALFAPSTGTVNPWRLGIAAWENAAANGCDTRFNFSLRSIEAREGLYILRSENEEITCRSVINCAGAAADRVQEMLFPPSVRLFPDGADFLVLDKRAKSPGRIIFHQAAEHGKGITAIPTVEGNLLLGPSRRDVGPSPSATTKEGLDFLREDARRILPQIQLEAVIRSFAGIRPNPHRVVLKDGEYVKDGSSIGSFVIERPAPGFTSLIGIKTPGITCAAELGKLIAEETKTFLNAACKVDFKPERKEPRPEAGSQIICRCEGISREEIIQAINRGARTADAVKRRCGSGMGQCQGSRCSFEIQMMLEEYRNGKL